MKRGRHGQYFTNVSLQRLSKASGTEPRPPVSDQLWPRLVNHCRFFLPSDTMALPAIPRIELLAGCFAPPKNPAPAALCHAKLRQSRPAPRTPTKTQCFATKNDRCAKISGKSPAPRASTNWTDIETDILDRKSSIGLLHLSGQIFDSSLSVEKLGSHPILFFVRPGHPLAALKSVTLAEIMAFPVVAIPHIPSATLSPRVEARKSISTAPRAHPSFPAVIHSSPAVSARIVKKVMR
jgi:hypothetical protein